MSPKLTALSLKQPWAALLAHGRKTIEIRKWSTQRRGPILIHASRTVDDRAEAWQHVSDDIKPTAELLGGIIGVANLMDCRMYRTLRGFAEDQAKHLNEPEWFENPPLYGFRFAKPRVLPFFTCPGWFRMFEVELPEGALSTK
jgi:hypothetical protein